jgi:SAM-dependent methyltransferase
VNLDAFNWLLTDAGQALLGAAQSGDLSDAGRLRELTRLRRLAAPERAAAAYEIAWVRRRAAAKFANADAMYFTREALEQSSGELIASYRARRYAGCSRVADLACGAGGDMLALARVAHVVAVDRDPLRLAMAEANARARGLAGRVAFLEADLEQAPPPDADAIFFDPARRSGGRRVFALAEYQPPVSIVREWRARIPAIGVKVAPGVSDDDLGALDIRDLEVEFISVDGELKEAVLWIGPLAVAGRRATVLRGVRTPADLQVDAFGLDTDVRQREHGANLQTCSLAPPGAYLYEPDPAVIRAGLVTTLAEQIGAAQIDREIAYLTADRAVATPFARCWPIVEWLPFSLKRLRARLRALDAGAVTAKKRGSPLDTDALARQLSGGGARRLVVVLTRVDDQPAAIICDEPVRFGGA